jgi:hypothetical protein
MSALKLWVWHATNGAPLQHEFSKGAPLDAHVQKICSHFRVHNAEQHCLCIDKNNHYVTQSEFSATGISVPDGAKLYLKLSPKFEAEGSGRA